MTLSKEIEEAVHAAVKQRKCIVTSNMVSNAVADAAYCIFDGVGKNELMGQSKQQFGDKFYSPFIVVCWVDVKGNINLSNINQLCNLETGGAVYKCCTILLSTAALQNCMAKMEKLGDEKVSFRIEGTMEGKSITFDYSKVLTLLI